MRRFNLYLVVLAGLLCMSGCAWLQSANKVKAAVRVHLQTPDDAAAGQIVRVLRSEPLLVHIGADPVLTEFHVQAARLVNGPAGFAVEIEFNRTGALMLEQYTGSSVGRHLAIFAQWGEKMAEGRWLAAPLIQHRVAGGVLAFTPDASREEMEVFVKGLNDTAAKVQKQTFK